MERNKYQKIIAQVLGTKPIAFNPDLAKVLGSAKAGLFLSQLLFWWGKGNNPNWIYKTIGEMKKETTLSRAEQDSAIKICKKLGLLKVDRKGIPAKRYFLLDIPKIVKLLESTLSENGKQDCDKIENLFDEKSHTNAENTTKNTNKEDSLYKRSESEIRRSLSFKKKPYFRGNEMRWSQNKWWVIEDGEWLEFVGKKSEIDWR